MKTIALIGASGFVGSAILKEALYRDLQVTAIVRRPESIALRSLNLETRTADAADPTTLREAVRNHDAVISAYNPGRNNPDIYEQTLSVYPRIVEAVKLAGIKRLLVVGGAGSLYVGPGMRLLDSGCIPERLLPGVKALAEVYETVLKPENELDWVFFSPAAELVPGKRTGKFRIGRDELIRDASGKSSISVEFFRSIYNNLLVGKNPATVLLLLLVPVTAVLLLLCAFFGSEYFATRRLVKRSELRRLEQAAETAQEDEAQE